MSIQALLVRAHNLGTIDARRRVSIEKMISKRGWRTVEPLTELLPREEPKLLSKIVSGH